MQDCAHARNFILTVCLEIASQNEFIPNIKKKVKEASVIKQIDRNPDADLYLGPLMNKQEEIVTRKSSMR